MTDGKCRGKSSSTFREEETEGRREGGGWGRVGLGLHHSLAQSEPQRLLRPEETPILMHALLNKLH